MMELPTSRIPDPADAPVLRWGLLGTGWIAAKFAASLTAHTAQRIVAVGSRNQESADRFAREVGADAAYGSYEALVAAPDIDVIYIATPHHLHHAHALLAIEAGKHVLIEKPIAVSHREAQEIAATAQRAGVFAMEALWTLFTPKYDVIRQLLPRLEVETMLADMGEYFAPEHRIFDAELAGGPLFDLGAYPLSLALWALGSATAVAAAGTPAANGINGQLAITLQAERGLAALHCSILGETPTTATLAGPDATLRLDGPFYQPGGFTVTTRAGQRLRYDEPTSAHEGGLCFEAAEVARRITAGELDSPLRPLADSVELLRVMDLIRHQVGIANPSSQPRGVTGSPGR